MDRWAGKIAVVTGAASGIGASTTKKLLENNIIVVGLDLQFQNPEISTPKNQFYPIKADVTDEKKIVDTFKRILENLGPVHILVNCAGVLETTTLIHGDAKLWKKTLDINILGVCIVTREAIKIMREHNVNGHVIHINSVVGHVVLPSPNLNVYPASKFAITALAQTLRQELDAVNSKIKISSISPGPTMTQLMIKRYREKGLPKRPYLNPEDVADSIVYVLSTPKQVQVTELRITGL